jgi:hypothetical protein
MKKYILFKSNENGDGIKEVYKTNLTLEEALSIANKNYWSYCDEILVEGFDFKFYSYKKSKLC